jgi:dolichyl-phosphate-mannose--protein O-mannosyl transferase
MAHFGDPHVVRYGVPVKLRHVKTGHALHSHLINYTTGSHQQEVTCFHERDDNDWWIVKGPHSDNRFNALIGTPVLNHHVVRLEHVLTGRNLHSHSGITSPASHQQEVTAFGEHGIGDDNDNWRLEVVHAEPNHPWRVEHQVRLTHVLTHHHLHSHPGHHTHSHQQEVTCFGHSDDNDLWSVDYNA